MRHDFRARSPQRLIAAGVIEVPVGVEHQVDFVRIDQGHGFLHFARALRKPAIDHHQPAVADHQRHAASVARQHHQRIGKLRRRDGRSGLPRRVIGDRESRRAANQRAEKLTSVVIRVFNRPVLNRHVLQLT